MKELTDFELNKAIAEALYPDARKIEKYHPAKNNVLVVRDNAWNTIWDYCNSWNDLMQFVVKHKITLEWDDPDWTASYNIVYRHGEYLGCDHEVTLKNPQRALAECLLKVLEAK